MAKRPTTIFVCQECGAQSAKWLGRCADCGAWNSLVEERTPDADQSAGLATHRYAAGSASSSARLYADIQLEHHARLSTAIDEFDRVLGVVSLRRAEDAALPDELVREIEQLVEERRAAKQRRDFATADQIRKTLADRGILLEDSPTGTIWKKK